MNRSEKIEIENSAIDFRNKYGYNAGEPMHLSSLLIKLEVISIFKPLSGSFSGMAIKTPEDLRFMLINRIQTIGRQHFTIGHELYHLFIQKNFSNQRCITGYYYKQTDIEEIKADYFSACLLLPEQGIKKLIPPEETRQKNLISDVTIFKIQQYYRLSVDAVITRLQELEFVDKSYSGKYLNEKKSVARKLGYDMTLFEPRKEDKFIGDYGVIANRLFNNNKISESYYFELMNDINVDPFEPADNGRKE